MSLASPSELTLELLQFQCYHCVVQCPPLGGEPSLHPPPLGGDRHNMGGGGVSKANCGRHMVSNGQDVRNGRQR